MFPSALSITGRHLQSGHSDTIRVPPSDQPVHKVSPRMQRVRCYKYAAYSLTAWLWSAEECGGLFLVTKAVIIDFNGQTAHCERVEA